MATKTKTADKSLWRRSASAYIGLYGMAYDRAQMRRDQARELTENLFEFLSEKGETTVKQAEVLAKKAQKGAWKNYSEAADKMTEILPVPVKSKVERLEDELADLQATLERMTKAAKPKANKTTAKKATVKKTLVKKPVAKKTVAKKAAAKPTAQKELPLNVKTKKVETKATVKETVMDKAAKTEALAKAPARTVTAPKTDAKTPRHIPYFVEVKRYDPLANEDVVRKIVNHCGIALNSEDARYVACSDESERATVRDSWLKKKLGLAAENADFDKKVLEVCTLMQRDQKKNRVTFYYLLAKKERMLDSL